MARKSKSKLNQIRVMHGYGTFHGFNLQPGMLFGKDNRGYFVTRCEYRTIERNYREARTGKWVCADTESLIVWRTTGRGKWHCDFETDGFLLETLSSEKGRDLISQAITLHDMAKAVKSWREQPDEWEEFSSELEREIGLRMTDYHNFNGSCKPPYIANYTRDAQNDKRTEIQTENNRVAINVTSGIRYTSYKEDPMHPMSRGRY